MIILTELPMILLYDRILLIWPMEAHHIYYKQLSHFCTKGQSVYDSRTSMQVAGLGQTTARMK